MFKDLAPAGQQTVTIIFEGVPCSVKAHMTVAAAVLEIANGWTRSTCHGQHRGPYCHMGVCYECLMTINGVPNQQACLISVTEGMRVERQRGVPDFSPESAAKCSCSKGGSHA